MKIPNSIKEHCIVPNNNLFKIKHKPYYFYSFVENKWVNNNNFLNENDIVTRIDELNDEMASATSTVGGLAAATLTDVASASAAEAYKKFYNEFDKDSNQQRRIELIKSHFHVYFIDNQKTIIWKELLTSLEVL